MARKQSPILDSSDVSNYSFVIQWISRRFDEEERELNKYVMSLPVCQAMDEPGGGDTVKAHADVRASWRELKKLWVDGWDKERDNKLANADDYFDNLIERTNQWLDAHFPAVDDAPGLERKRLLAAVRQQRLREKRKGAGLDGCIQVSITGDLYKALYKHWRIPESKRHDVVRAALQLVLENPDLLAKSKEMAGVTT